MSNIETERTTLHPAEVADLQLAAFGFRRVETADARGVSSKAVAKNREKIFSVLKARDIGHAIAKGIDGGHILLPAVEPSHVPLEARLERAIAWLNGMELLVKQVLLKRSSE